MCLCVCLSVRAVCAEEIARELEQDLFTLFESVFHADMGSWVGSAFSQVFVRLSVSAVSASGA